MMSVKEYANDVNLDVTTIMELCKKLKIQVQSTEDILDDDAIILLDNEIINLKEEQADEAEIIEEEEELIESSKDFVPNQNSNNKTQQAKKKKKQNKNTTQNKKNDFKKQRKEMYKHKDKLKSNTYQLDESIVLYKEGMTVGEFATALNTSVGEVIKKLMSLGMMMNLNQVIDFDTAAIISSDFGRELKREETTDEVNFEELELQDS